MVINVVTLWRLAQQHGRTGGVETCVDSNMVINDHDHSDITMSILLAYVQGSRSECFGGQCIMQVCQVPDHCRSLVIRFIAADVVMLLQRLA